MLAAHRIKSNLFALLLLASMPILAQTQELNGKVVDPDNNPLEGANIIALPKSGNSNPQFTVTDKQGTFTLQLRDSLYELKISYLGFTTKTLIFDSKIEKHLTITLEEQATDLDKVTLNYTPEPIVVNKDSIIFDVKDFIDGSEYKLEEILKNLPGVEYTNGKLTINGKDVTQALIEGEKFFSGNTALAVENIPAKVVKKIEFVDDYNDVAFLKNVSHSDKLIMNIKLKDPNSSFSFGELDAKYGNSNYYEANPSYYNYSKKRSIAILGASNNIGEPLRNVLNLESLESGGHLIHGKNTSGLGRYIFPQKEVKSLSDHAFATGFKNKLTEKTTINSYFIHHIHKDERQTRMKNQYFDPLASRIELRSQYGTQRSNISLGNLELSSKMSSSEEIRYSLNVEDGKDHRLTNIDTSIDLNTRSLNTVSGQTKLRLSNWFGWYKRFSNSLIFQFEAAANNLGNENGEEYLSDDPLFAGFFPGSFHHKIQQHTVRELTTYTINTKINKRLDHNQTVSLTTGMDAINDQFKMDINGGSCPSNSFGDSSTATVHQIEFFVAPEYLLKKNRFVAEVSLELRNRQLKNQNKIWIAPSFDLKYKKSIGTEISLSYKYKDQMTSTKNRYGLELGTIQSFNSVLYTNDNLRSQKYHEVRLGGGYANIFKGFTSYGMLEFKRYERSVIYQVTYLDQLQLLTPQNTSAEKYEIFSRVNIGKMFKKFKLRFTPRFQYIQAPQLNNGLESTTKSRDLNIRIGGETTFDKNPNVDLSYARGYRDFKTPFLNTNYNSDNVRLMLTKTKGTFKYKFIYDFYRISDSFEKDLSKLSFEMSYDFKTKPWKISLYGHNILNNSVSTQNIIDSTIISERETKILPSMVLFGVIYKI